MMKHARTFFLSLLLAASLAGGAAAEDVVGGAMDEASSPSGLARTVVALGVAAVPDYIGSDDYRGAPLLFAKHTFEGSRRYVKLSGLSLEGNLLNLESVAFGPVVKYRMKRDDSVDDERVKDMEELKGGLEAGAFVRYDHRGTVNRRNRESVDLRFVADASGEYDGYQFDLEGTLWRQVADKVDCFVGVGTTWADDKYMEAHFGVDAENVGTSGLPDFSADGGVRDVRGTAGAVYYFDRNWLFGGVVRYSALLGDGADSPLVDGTDGFDGRGSADQVMGGLFAGYMW